MGRLAGLRLVLRDARVAGLITTRRVACSPTRGTALGYRNWLTRWGDILRRARVSPREGDAQKAMRRSFVTASLVCGREPKVIAAELGHTTPRMILEVYDSFLDANAWPDEAEQAALSPVYGWHPAGTPLQMDESNQKPRHV